ncbi:MAG: DUF3124 domain-containing protein [Candidatus Dechloromonas phosphoritropha]
MKRSESRGFLRAVVFGLFLASTVVSAQEIRMLSSGGLLYLPIYSHVVFGNLGRSGTPSQVSLSTLASIRNTDPRRPLRVLTARYFDTDGKLIGERVPKPVVVPPLGTLELFIERNDLSGGSGANFIIKWDASSPINPPLVEALHVNMDGGKAVVFMTQSQPIEDPAAQPARQ